MNKGFSLLEAVVALAIVGLAAVAALAAFTQELRTGAQASRALEAQALAESRLAAVRLLQRSELEPLTDTLRSGRFAPPLDGYRWESSSQRVSGQEDLFQVTISVRWNEGAYSLGTRLYRPRPLATR